MTVKIIVDTSIILSAFATSPENNKYWEFLQLFLDENKAGKPILYLCLDYSPSKIYEEYIAALSRLSRKEAIEEFREWYEAVAFREAIEELDGRLEELRWYKKELETKGCRMNELVFIARAFFNKRKNFDAMIIADHCDIKEFRKRFLIQNITKYLIEHMQIELLDISGARTKIQNIRSHNNNQTTYLGDLEESRSELKRLMKACFNLEEIKELCYDLHHIPYEDVVNNQLTSSILKLIWYCERHGMISRLVDSCKKARPTITWPNPWKPEQVNQKTK